jgi:GxxExxY protein
MLVREFLTAGERRGTQGMGLGINQISGAVVNSAMCVHTELGPGLLEEAYKPCLAAELTSRWLHVLVEHALPVMYKSARIEIAP